MFESNSVSRLPTPGRKSNNRIASVDLLRGLVILLMLLDHLRYFFFAGKGGLREAHLLSLGEYLTLWLPRFCAPVFFILAGVSVSIQRSRGKSSRQLTHDLIIRGLLLVILELCVVRFAWVGFAPLEHLLQVLWCLGLSMMLLTFFLVIPRWVVALVAIAIVGGSSSLATLIERSEFSGESWAVVLFQTGVIKSAIFGEITVVYPVVGWFGMMLGGFAMGDLYQLREVERKKWLMTIGILLLIGFVTSGFLNSAKGLVDPHDFNLASFLAPEKFPPSFAYSCLSGGVALLFLSLCPDQPKKYFNWLISIGQTALFVYVTHLLAIKAASIGLLLFGHGFTEIGKKTDALFWIYVYWLILSLVLYPTVVWYKRVKRESESRWLHYF